MRGAVECVASFFFNDTATTEIYTLSLHDALPISACWLRSPAWTSAAYRGLRASTPRRNAVKIAPGSASGRPVSRLSTYQIDRKSTRLNSSHANISYAVFCLKKKTHIPILTHPQHL